MMNGADLLAAIVFGLAVPLALSSVLRFMWQDGVVEISREAGMTAGQVAAAFFAGPGLLIDRLLDNWQEGSINHEDFALGMAAAIAWAFVYGTVFLQIASRLFQLP